MVRLVFNEAGNKLFWRCPWCPFSRDAPSSMHTHFERRHPALLGGISKVAYLRPCADRDGKVRAFLSGPTIGSFTNPRPLGKLTWLSLMLAGLGWGQDGTMLLFKGS